MKNEKTVILATYVFFFISIIMMALPSAYPALIGMILCVLILMGLYSARSKAEEGSMTETHMSYLIRTFWRANLFLLYALVPALIYAALYISYNKVWTCLTVLPPEMIDSMRYTDTAQLEALANACVSTFMSENKKPLMIAALIAFGPVGSYILVQFSLGLHRLTQNKPIVSP